DAEDKAVEDQRRRREPAAPRRAVHERHHNRAVEIGLISGSWRPAQGEEGIDAEAFWPQFTPRPMTVASLVSIGLAIAAVFLVADLIYVVDHYLVHHDKERYALTHIRHHRRYGGSRDASHLDSYELSTYSSAGLVSFLVTSVVSLLTGNVGFIIGAVLKFAHS